MIRITLQTSVVAALLALSALACGGSDESDKSNPAAAVPAVPTSTTDPECGAVPPNLAGTYTTETKTDELPPEVADMQIGTFELMVGPGHRFVVLAPQGNEIDLSPACVQGSQIAVAEEPAGGSCSGFGPGVYGWAVQGDKVVFTKVHERCVDRAYSFTAKPWNRKQPPSLTEDATTTTTRGCGTVPAALAGKWTKTIRTQELPPEIADLDTGVFVMTLGPAHYMRVDVDDNHRGTDTKLCWEENRMSIVSKRDDCEGQSIGIYTWKRHGDELDFVLVRDECFWRPFPTTVRTWKRVR